MAQPGRVLVIEDHPLLRDALAVRIHDILGAEIGYCGGSVAEALAAHSEGPAACAVLDLDLGDGRPPLLNVIDLVAAGVPVLIVSAIADPGTVRAALQAGALGFVSKQAPVQDFRDALEAAVVGEPYTSQDVAAILSSGEAPAISLSERERTALVLYASGMKMDAVARTMGVQPSTAQEYIRRIRDKYMRAGTPAASRVDLYRRARDDGFVP